MLDDGLLEVIKRFFEELDLDIEWVAMYCGFKNSMNVTLFSEDFMLNFIFHGKLCSSTSLTYISCDAASYDLVI